ncbi:unnamed protein product [Bursaphelenchus okinawaensis]|uniref:Uncharacterized protein n=1 Tax=Bursaphelenchus okinawaensis TaxID=465554 RepID=A0A811L8S0_9BILA|nr:unnamed protein product [Bursaphelenchus okinawaensis]CAG9119434.1 unnamed protein product [Bursaphelenchus okinawaensis]
MPSLNSPKTSRLQFSDNKSYFINGHIRCSSVDTTLRAWHDENVPKKARPVKSPNELSRSKTEGERGQQPGIKTKPKNAKSAASPFHTVLFLKKSPKV